MDFIDWIFTEEGQKVYASDPAGQRLLEEFLKKISPLGIFSAKANRQNPLYKKLRLEPAYQVVPAGVFLFYAEIHAAKSYLPMLSSLRGGDF